MQLNTRRQEYLKPGQELLGVSVSEHRRMGTLHDGYGVEQQRQPGLLWRNFAGYQHHHQIPHCCRPFLQLHMNIAHRLTGRTTMNETYSLRHFLETQVMVCAARSAHT